VENEVSVRVRTAGGGEVDGWPRAFLLRGIEHEIVDIEDRWYGSDVAYFRVFADDAHRYILKREKAEGDWWCTKVG
jgi:hypothetical protein